MNFLEKSRNKLVHFLFPFIERFYPFVSLVLLVAAWSVPETYWQIRVALFLLWFVNNEIYYAGTMERDYLPVQSGNSPFYYIYRFIDGTSFLLFPVLPVILPILGPLWIKNGLVGLLVLAVILRAVGDRKYRPKKPEE